MGKLFSLLVKILIFCAAFCVLCALLPTTPLLLIYFLYDRKLKHIEIMAGARAKKDKKDDGLPSWLKKDFSFANNKRDDKFQENMA